MAAPTISYLNSDTSRTFDVLDNAAEIGGTVGDIFNGICTLIPKGTGEVAASVAGSQRTIGCFRTIIAVQSLYTLKCAYKDNEGKVELKDYLLIAVSVAFIAGRLLGFSSSLHTLKVINLSQNIQRINLAVTALFTAGVTLLLVHSIREYQKATGDKVEGAKVDLLQSGGWFVMNGVDLLPAAVLPITVGTITTVTSAVLLATLLYQAKKGFRKTVSGEQPPSPPVVVAKPSTADWCKLQAQASRS